jgi:hypothetical protein
MTKKDRKRTGPYATIRTGLSARGALTRARWQSQPSISAAWGYNTAHKNQLVNRVRKCHDSDRAVRTWIVGKCVDLF